MYSEEEMGKKILLEKIKLSELKTGFGNPRKIKKQSLSELEESIKNFGDFGLFVIDEKNNLISGTQRARAMINQGIDVEVDCKRLVGYTEIEKRIINVKCNQHSGEWDAEKLATWLSDVDLKINIKDGIIEGGEVDGMPLNAFEKYDFVMIVCRNELDFINLQRKLGIENKKQSLNGKKMVKARAVWYDEIERLRD